MIYLKKNIHSAVKGQKIMCVELIKKLQVLRVNEASMIKTFLFTVFLVNSVQEKKSRTLEKVSDNNKYTVLTDRMPVVFLKG